MLSERGGPRPPREERLVSSLAREIEEAGYVEFTASMSPAEAATRKAVASKIPGVSFWLRTENDPDLTNYGRQLAGTPGICVGTTHVENLEGFNRYTKLVYQSRMPH